MKKFLSIFVCFIFATVGIGCNAMEDPADDNVNDNVSVTDNNNDFDDSCAEAEDCVDGPECELDEDCDEGFVCASLDVEGMGICISDRTDDPTVTRVDPTFTVGGGPDTPIHPDPDNPVIVHVDPTLSPGDPGHPEDEPEITDAADDPVTTDDVGPPSEVD